MCVFGNGTEIAVLLGPDGTTVPAGEPGVVVIYRREGRQWQDTRTFPLRLDESGGLAGLRKTMADLRGFLGECRALVALSAGGAVFFELEKARIAVFELPGRPEEFLDTVWQEMREEQEASAPPAGTDIPAPLEIAPGHFTISIRDIQGKRPELSSKQVLREFVRKGEFSELEIACDHVPPWIEAEAVQRGYDLTSERTGLHDCKVILRKSTGGGCC